jgi:hypothetical protein
MQELPSPSRRVARVSRLPIGVTSYVSDALAFADARPAATSGCRSINLEASATASAGALLAQVRPQLLDHQVVIVLLRQP